MFLNLFLNTIYSKTEVNFEESHSTLQLLKNHFQVKYIRFTFSRLVFTTYCKSFSHNKSFTCNGDGEIYIKLQHLTFSSNSDLFYIFGNFATFIYRDRRNWTGNVRLRKGHKLSSCHPHKHYGSNGTRAD